MHQHFRQNMTYNISSLMSENVPWISYFRYVLLYKECPIFIPEINKLHFDIMSLFHVFRITNQDNSDNEVS